MECIRWLAEIWAAAGRLRRQDMDLRAVTAWSLFGAMDWRSLMRKPAQDYEPGAFDVRSDPPQLTGLGAAVRSLVEAGHIESPEANAPGWWRRPERTYPPQAPRRFLASRR